MSNWNPHTRTVVLLMVIAIGSSAMARQAAPPAAPAQAPAPAGQGNAGLNVAQMPTPEIGKPYRFSLCSGEVLAPTAVSKPCGRVTFRLQNGSFLPPGLHLDGFGVISGTTNVDVSKLNVRICAIQIGAYGSNFNCQGQPVGFAGGKAAVLNPPPPAPAPVTPVPPGGGGGGGGGGASVLKVVGGSVAAAGAGLAAANLLSNVSGPDCSSQRSSLDSAMNSLATSVNSLSACGSNVNCLTARQGAVDNAVSSIASAAGDYCVCMGGAAVSAAEKAQLQGLLQSLGNRAGSLPSCFR